MKHLSHYVQEQQTALFNLTGAFFAFSQDQLNEKRVKCIIYVSLGAGLICPKNTADDLSSGLETIQQAGIKADIAENGIPAIIQRELHNHECQITMDSSDAFDALEQYGITKDQVGAAWPEFWNNCVENDYF